MNIVCHNFSVKNCSSAQNLFLSYEKIVSGHELHGLVVCFFFNMSSRQDSATHVIPSQIKFEVYVVLWYFGTQNESALIHLNFECHQQGISVWQAIKRYGPIFSICQYRNGSWL